MQAHAPSTGQKLPSGGAVYENTKGHATASKASGAMKASMGMAGASALWKTHGA